MSDDCSRRKASAVRSPGKRGGHRSGDRHPIGGRQAPSGYRVPHQGGDTPESDDTPEGRHVLLWRDEQGWPAAHDAFWGGCLHFVHTFRPIMGHRRRQAQGAAEGLREDEEQTADRVGGDPLPGRPVYRQSASPPCRRGRIGAVMDGAGGEPEAAARLLEGRFRGGDD